jgi:6-pyruvoyltetrahydropterin/6-carboxytetrahydropterin synthase
VRRLTLALKSNAAFAPRIPPDGGSAARALTSSTTMSAPHVEIVHREEFAAAHRLHNPALSDEENRRIFGACNNEYGHGHNYVLDVVVRGTVDPRTGMVMNLVDLAGLVHEEIFTRCDHKHLNQDVDFLSGIITTAENLAIAFWERLAPRIEEHGACRLHRIRVYESRKDYVDYKGPQG